MQKSVIIELVEEFAERFNLVMNFWFSRLSMLALNFNERKTIQDDLVFEGVAEHFREVFEGGGKAEWVKSISKDEARSILREIEPSPGTENEQFYLDLFLGTGKFPLWAGYAIGYYLVESYLNQLEEKDWINIIKISVLEIMTQSNF